MPTLTIHQGTRTQTAQVERGLPLSAALQKAGFSVAQPCGGRGVCGKCAIELTGCASAPNAAEVKAGVRLACQAVIEGDCAVSLPLEREMEIEQGAAVHAALELQQGVGAAIDIGTTTLALQLFDLQTGALLAASALLNPQTAVAADVIGRIQSAMSGGADTLQGQILSAIRTLTVSAAAQAGLSPQQIAQRVITGNTTMLHLLTHRDPTPLSRSPFVADWLADEDAQLPDTPAYLPPCLHAFVGADITCAVLHSGMTKSDKPQLLCDIGTNGELALWKEGVLYVTSTAAGPAFEGAGITCGCSSVTGAIDRVQWASGNLVAHTIGGAPAVGLCGSGLIDCVAALLDAELLDETGYLEEDMPLADKVFLAPADVRQVQLSKAAISAGIQCLLGAAQCDEEDIETVYIAGGFGSHLDLRSAARIGLLPESFVPRVKILGNAALNGAADLLLSPSKRLEARKLFEKAQHVALGGSPTFNEAYMDAMFFE